MPVLRQVSDAFSRFIEHFAAPGAVRPTDLRDDFDRNRQQATCVHWSQQDEQWTAWKAAKRNWTPTEYFGVFEMPDGRYISTQPRKADTYGRRPRCQPLVRR